MAPKIKVAIIAGQLVVGGAERQLYLWLANLDRTKFNPFVITLNPGHDDYWEKPIEDLGVPLFRVHQKPSRLLRLIDIIKILRPLQPDIIQGWHLFSSPYAGIAAKAMNCCSLGGFRDSYNIFVKSGRIGKLAVKLTDGILVNSNTTAEEIQSAYPHRSERVFSVQNAVIDDYFERSKAREKLIKEFKLDPQKTWVGAMGRLDPKKRFDLLLQVLSKINDESFQCLLIGDGPEMEKLVNLSSALGIRHKIFFTGEIPNASLYLKALEIFIFTSLDEGLPNVILEAGAAGLPILTWDIPFYREVLPEREQGFLIPTADIQSFTTTLSSLLINPEIRSEVGSSARERVLSVFNLQSYVENMTALYDSIFLAQLNNKPTRR